MIASGLSFMSLIIYNHICVLAQVMYYIFIEISMLYKDCTITFDFYVNWFYQERLFQFWFNTFFISQAAWTEEIQEDEPTLHTFELDPNLRYFDIGKDNLDKAHKDAKEKMFKSDFRVSGILNGTQSSKNQHLEILANFFKTQMIS